MRVDLVFPVLPPVLDGIGDYTAQLARALSTSHDVRVLTAQENALTSQDEFTVEEAFDVDSRSGVLKLSSAIDRNPPDWLVLQYNSFSYGRWGFNPWLTRLPARIRSSSPSTQLAVMVHEPFVPFEGWRFSVMATWQRWQLWRLGQSADALFFSTQPWAEQFQTWFRSTPVHHLPVGSNMPRVSAGRETVRSELGFVQDDYVIGLFGSGHFSRLLHFVRAAVEEIQQEIPNAKVLYIGPAGKKVTEALYGIPVLNAGALPAEEVSRRFATMDLYLAPFNKGVSTRRGSFLVGLQHGLPTVSTHGIHTGSALHAEDGRAFVLSADDEPSEYAAAALAVATDSARAKELALRGQRLYDTMYDWPIIAESMCSHLASGDQRPALYSTSTRVHHGSR